MAQSDEEKWLQYAEEYGSPLEDQNKVVVVEEDDIDETMSIPGLQYNIDPTTSTRAIPLRYVQLHLSSLFRKISAMLQTVTNAVRDLAQIKTETNAAKDAANQAAGSVQEAIDAAEVATNDANTAASNANAKAVLANTAASNADTSRQAIEQNESTRQSNESTRQQNETTRGQNEQSRVNAETLREQQSISDHQQYLSDTQRAGQDHNRAVQDHTLAGQDHETASNDHDTALQDHRGVTDAIDASETQTDIAEEYNQHPPYIGNDNYWYLYNTTTHAYVRAAYAKGNDLDYSTMTPEEVQMLIDNIKADLIVASVETCESIIDELT